MDRPMFYFGSCYLWTLMLISLTGAGMAWGLLGTAAAAALWLCRLLLKKRQGKRKLRFFLAAALIVLAACVAFLLETKLVYEPAVSRAGEELSGTFVVTEVLNDSSSGAHRCVLKAEGDAPVRRVRFSSSNYVPRVGDVFPATLSLKRLGEQDPAVARYYKSRGLFLGATASERVTAETFSEAAATGLIDPPPVRLAWWDLRLRLVALREALSGAMEEWLAPEEAAVLNGMLVGDKTGLSEETSTALKRAGVLHLFAVSGFHVALWSMLVHKLFLRLGAGRKTAGGGALLFLFLFVALTGFPRSAVRAGVMLGVFFLGRMSVRSPDPLNSLGTAAFLVVLPDPFYAGDTGVLLSYFATLGILALYPPLWSPVREALKEKIPRYKLRKRVEDLAALALLALCTSLATLPVVTLSFGAVSLVSVLSNLLVSSASSAAILLSGIGALCSFVPGLSLLTPWCFLAGGGLARWTVAVCEALSGGSLSYVSLSGRGFGLGLAAAMLTATAGFVLYGSLPDRGLVRVTALLSAIVLLASVLTETALDRNVAKVTFADVAGTCVVLTYRRAAFAVGCGSDGYETGQALEDLLQRAGAGHLTALIVPRESRTESGALETVEETFQPDLLLRPEDFAGPEVQRIRLLPDAVLTLYRQDGEYPAALLEVQDVRFLLCFRPTVDLSALPAEAQTAPVSFFRGKRPEGLKSPPSSYIIVSGETGEIEARVCRGKVRLYRW